MRVFLDANILVSVLNKEFPYYTFTSRILSMADSKENKTTLVTTTICLAIAFYFSEKKHGHVVAKNKIGLLVEHMEIVTCGQKEALLAVQNRKILDFEDGMQYYAALHAKCDCIVTNDLDDFYFSDLQVLGPERFFRQYVR